MALGCSRCRMVVCTRCWSVATRTHEILSSSKLFKIFLSARIMCAYVRAVAHGESSPPMWGRVPLNGGIHSRTLFGSDRGGGGGGFPMGRQERTVNNGRGVLHRVRMGCAAWWHQVFVCMGCGCVCCVFPGRFWAWCMFAPVWCICCAAHRAACLGMCVQLHPVGACKKYGVPMKTPRLMHREKSLFFKIPFLRIVVLLKCKIRFFSRKGR